MEGGLLLLRNSNVAEGGGREGEGENEGGKGRGFRLFRAAAARPAPVSSRVRSPRGRAPLGGGRIVPLPEGRKPSLPRRGGTSRGSRTGGPHATRRGEDPSAGEPAGSCTPLAGWGAEGGWCPFLRTAGRKKMIASQREGPCACLWRIPGSPALRPGVALGVVLAGMDDGSPARPGVVGPSVGRDCTPGIQVPHNHPRPGGYS